MNQQIKMDVGMKESTNSLFTLREPMAIDEISLSQKTLKRNLVATIILAISALICSLYLHSIEKLGSNALFFIVITVPVILLNRNNSIADKMKTLNELDKATHHKKYIELAGLADDPDVAAYLSQVHQMGRSPIVHDYLVLKDWAEKAETRQKLLDADRKLSYLINTI